ncbi:MAG: PAS domain S-box protein [Burkholderiales bacterium]
MNTTLGFTESGFNPWHDRLALLLESTGEGIFGIDLQGRCNFINRAGARMLGYRQEAVLGQNMHCLIHHAHADGRHYPETDCPIFRAFRQGDPCRVDSEVLWRADGSSFPAEYSSHPIVENGNVLGAAVTFVDITERKRAEELTRLRELSAYLDGVREEERTRIAREIHDELGSLLIALKLDVAWLGRRISEPPLAAKCRAMAGLIEGAVENVGRIITDLRPSILDHQGLWAALEWQAREFGDTAELACDVRMAIDVSAAEPQGKLASAVFRVFQEMLSNVARHAMARSVKIRVCASDNDLEVEVADDGCGASAQAFESATAYGVMGMRERVGHFQGELSIDSTLGQGTTVRLCVPLKSSIAASRMLVEEPWQGEGVPL